jgi:small subunit ribosomal protein S1
MSSEENQSSSIETGTEAESPIEATEPNSILPESTEIGHLIESMETFSTMAQGETVQATVLNVTDGEVVIDLGLKSEGVIPRSEFSIDNRDLTPQPGDTIDVWIEHFDEKEGTVSVSYQRAARWKAWDNVERAFQEQTTVMGRVVERIKGGLTVDIGVRAFLPGSQADTRPHYNLDSLVGQEIPCKVIKLNKKRNNAVVSRRMALEEELSERKSRLLEQLQEGAVLAGRVKNLTDYGVFVDLGGMDGLLHIADLSWGRVGHPSEVVRVGQELEVKVLKYDREKERVSLGLKQLTPDPWASVPSAYQPGARLTGRVVGIVDYGAFVELEPGVEGLIHVSEMTWSKRLKHPSKILHLGDRVEVAVLDVHAPQRRMSLSLKQTLPDPWSTLSERYAVGAVAEGRVRSLTDFGAFVEVEEGVDGLIHVSNLSWTRNVKHPSEVLRKGQRIEVLILDLDPAKRRLSLGLKQLQPDIWEEFFSRTKVGDIVRGKISRQASFGSFVEIEPGIEGLCHLSELNEEYAEGGAAQLEPAQEFDFRVIRLNPVEKKIGLSLKGVEQRPESPVAPQEEAEVQVAEAEPRSADEASAAEPPSPLPAPEA